LETANLGQVDVPVKVDCGEAGNKITNLRLIVVEQLFINYLPLIKK